MAARILLRCAQSALCVGLFSALAAVNCVPARAADVEAALSPGPAVASPTALAEDFAPPSVTATDPARPSGIAPLALAAGATAAVGAANGGPAIFSLSSVPNMIGDTSGGGCGALSVNGVVAASVEHPTFACSRLNIAEDNSPAIADRVYADYRHFEGASELDIFSFAPTGGRASFDIDRLTLGYEHIIWDTNSIELRLPINRQMSSNLFFSQFTGVGGHPPPIVSLPLKDYSTEIGNIDVIFKHQLVDTGKFYMSTGLGLNLPTAPNVRIDARINDSMFQVFNRDGSVAGTANVDLTLDSEVFNQTVNLSPFVGAIYHPRPDWFAQGFLQVDVPLNTSKATVDEVLNVNGNPAENIHATGHYEEQVLLRVNTGIGHWWWYDEKFRTVSSLGWMFESHYTTTLNNAVLTPTPPLVVAPDLGTGETTLQVGNLDNRVDVLDFILAVPAIIGKTTFTNSVCVPVRGATDREFSFEYCLSVDRRF